MTYWAILKLTRKLQKQRQRTSSFLKIDRRYWGPPIKGPAIAYRVAVIAYKLHIRIWVYLQINFSVGLLSPNIWSRGYFLQPLRDVYLFRVKIAAGFWFILATDLLVSFGERKGKGINSFLYDNWSHENVCKY